LPQQKDAAERVIERAQLGETAQAIDGGLWLHFPQGVGPSKITPGYIDKVCGSPTTGRNVRTIAKLAKMTREEK